jgi:hypothetical protein
MRSSHLDHYRERWQVAVISVMNFAFHKMQVISRLAQCKEFLCFRRQSVTEFTVSIAMPEKEHASSSNRTCAVKVSFCYTVKA